MEPIITNIPEVILPNTVIETGINSGVSCVEFRNWDLSLEKSQKEQYDWKYATSDCFRDEFYDDSDGYNCIFIEGYMTEEEAKVGHKRIVAEILSKGSLAECLQS